MVSCDVLSHSLLFLTQYPGLPPPCMRAHAVALPLSCTSRYYSSNPSFTSFPALPHPLFFFFRTLPPYYFHLHPFHSPTGR